MIAHRSDNVCDLLPWAAENPPWSGPAQSPEERGFLFATRGALGSVCLFYDRAERDFAMSVYPPKKVRAVHVLHGRLWRIRWIKEQPMGVA